MKRTFSVLITALAAAIALIDAASHDASRPNDPYFQYTGRTDFSDSAGPKMYYSGTSVRCVFEGTSVKATFSDYNYWGGGNKVQCFIDNDFVRIDSLVNGGRNQNVPIATGLADCEHLLVIYKISGPENGWLAFHGLSLDAGKGIVEPPPRPSLKIECYGTSVASGEHAGCQKHECGNDNGYNAYPMVFARRFNAEMHNNGISGLAVCNANGWFENGLTGLERTWDKLCPCNESGLKRTEWDFSRYTPQLLLMGMGINDNKINDDRITKATFIEKYLTISLKLDSIYNHPAFLYFVDPLGSTKGTYFTLVQQVADSMKSLGKKSHYYAFSKAIIGGHPDSSESAAMGNELADFAEQEKMLEGAGTHAAKSQKPMCGISPIALDARQVNNRKVQVRLISRKNCSAAITIADLLGRTRTLANMRLEEGLHNVAMPSGIKSGLWLMEAESSDGFVASCPVLLAK